MNKRKKNILLLFLNLKYQNTSKLIEYAVFIEFLKGFQG